MDHAAEFRGYLAALDAEGVRRMWSAVMPHISQPETEADMLVFLHRTRTQAESMPLKFRAYSHRWLCERGYPSGLPDRLKQSAERMYPTTQAVVGISTRTRTSLAVAVHDAMRDVVLEAQADRKLADADFVRSRMLSAREKILRQ